jgi:hypothetical protein
MPKWLWGLLLAVTIFTMAIAGCGDPANPAGSGGAGGGGASGSGGSTASPPFVYVQTTSGPVLGYSAAGDGVPTPLPGFLGPYLNQPVTAGGASATISGQYFFACDDDNDIATYRIGADGALTGIQSIDASAATGEINACAGNGLFVDRTGANLYLADVDYSGGSPDFSFQIDSATGALTYQGATTPQPSPFVNLETISGTGQYVYSSSYAWTYPRYELPSNQCQVAYYAREPGGQLVGSPVVVNTPQAPPNQMYCVFGLQADAGNHMVAAVDRLVWEGYFWLVDPPQSRLVTFTIHSDGTLSATGSWDDWPTFAGGLLDGLSDATSLSPSGNFLAVGGFSGIQVFNFNGTALPTPATGLLLAAVPPGYGSLQWKFQWDNENRLYALATNDEPDEPVNELYVFDVTSAGVVQAPGSPYDISNAFNVLVSPD